MRKIILATTALLVTGISQAQINPIAQENGFSGSVTAGAVYGDIASNFYKSDEHERIDNLGSPQGHSVTSPMIRFDLRYTLAESRTQFVLGNQIHDALRFDFTQLLGVRQEIANRGILSAGLVFSGIAPNEVWADPYKTNATREETKRDTKGVRLGWEGIMGSRFSVDLTSRRIDIDNEESGRSTTLTADQIAQLDRNGTTSRLRVSYDWEFAPRHFLSPGLIFGKDNLDGKAMRNNTTGFKLDYGFNAGNDTFSASLYLAQQSYDAGHPLFGNRKADSTDYALGVNYLRQGLFGYKWLGGYVNASYGKSDADIDFFNADFKRIGLGLRYKF
ncbi:MAG: DUF2860 family protein [Azonexus sp.]|jgi:hypothetical protein|nr:DUF2860 family protein [Azonexus sp.]